MTTSLEIIPRHRPGRAILAGLAGIALVGTAAPAHAEAPRATLPAFLSCRTVSDGTMCSGSRIVERAPYEQDLVCGEGPTAFAVWDQGIEHQRLTIWFDTDGNVSRIVNDERWTSAMWSNPVSGATLPYTQQVLSSLKFSDPADPGSGTESISGEIVFTDPKTQRHVLVNVGRTVVVPATGEILQSAGMQPLLSGDPAALTAACAALE